jgi:hypothetical protein
MCALHREYVPQSVLSFVIEIVTFSDLTCTASALENLTPQLAAETEGAPRNGNAKTKK